MQRRDLRLIELLIVVAIIAILEATAVPNFMEAQTRAKVSRSHADMRSLATAIESYVVDNNVTPYIRNTFGGTTGFYDAVLSYHWTAANEPSNPQAHRLTTPIAYISAYPQMAFQPGPRTEGMNDMVKSYSYWFIDLQGAAKDAYKCDWKDWEDYPVNVPTPVRFQGQETSQYANWVLFSLGPSLVLDIQPGGPGEGTYGGSISNPGWVLGDEGHYKGLQKSTTPPTGRSASAASIAPAARLWNSSPRRHSMRKRTPDAAWRRGSSLSRNRSSQETCCEAAGASLDGRQTWPQRRQRQSCPARGIGT